MNALHQHQHQAARVVGVSYLFAMAASIFTEGFLRARLIVGDDAVATARNILAHEGLFRLGIGVELMTFATDIALIVALFTILAPMHRPLALFAAAIRIAAETSFLTMAAGSLDVVRILSGADYLRAFGPDQLAALARLSLGSHSAAYGAGFVFLGIGSTVFAYLWIKSAYVPRALGVLGVVASFLLAAGSLEIIVMPRLGGLFYPWYMAPMFFFEVGMGVWLLWKGLRAPSAHPVHAEVGVRAMRSSGHLVVS